MSQVAAFAPATVANLGPGFDVLGLALEGMGDTVIARRCDAPGVRISAIHGDGGRLPTDAAENTAGIAATETLRLAGVEVGVELEINKGLPLGSGLGSSAASAAAAAHAVNLLIGSPLRKVDLIGPCVEAEAAVSGRHADNVAPAILGGLVLIRDLEPIDVVRLPLPDGLTMVVVSPLIEVATADARAAMPTTVTLPQMVAQAANLAALITASFSGDLALLSRSLNDGVATPARLPLIPEGQAVLDASLDAGALGAGISGSGPSLFALCRSWSSAERVSAAMVARFRLGGLQAQARCSALPAPGVRRLPSAQG
jgi:homoserine kinase